MRYFLYARKSTEDEERQALSLQSQQEALHRAFGGNNAVEIVDIFEESKSAKTPGRPKFAQMLARIENGEADGIVSWAPDRLARNSIDGGRIVYLLDTGLLKDLKFATYTFENNSQGKFMLSIMFGQSKYYSDALSENVKRGNRSKLERGWRPNRAPLGYRNDPATKTILPDPIHFPLVRRMFDMVLARSHSPREIVRIAREEWGFLTPRSKRSGGKPIAPSTIYKLLANPFYSGIIEWNGTTYAGSHQPVVTEAEFERVQEILEQRSTPHQQRYSFPYTGLLKCGGCGRMVTAERKKNRFGSCYVYYHCSARSVARNGCRERSVEGRSLDAQVKAFLSSLRVSDEVADWVRTELRESVQRDAEKRESEAQVRQQAVAEIAVQIDELTSLRLRRFMDDDEYLERRKQLERHRDVLQSAGTPTAAELIEPFELLILASNKAVEWFQAANADGKRALLKITGSNPELKGKMLSIQAAKPFFNLRHFGEIIRQRRVIDVDRIVPPQSLTKAGIRARGRKIIADLKTTTQTKDGRAWLEDVRQLIDRQEPGSQPVALKVASRRQVRASPHRARLREKAALRARVRTR